MKNRTLVFLIVPALFFAALPSRAQSGPATEYQVKAAFLFNFAKFTEWPSEPDQAPFTIAILGDDPFGSGIDDLFLGKTVRDKKIAVRRFSGVQQIEACHILFISRSVSKDVPAVLAALRENGLSGVLIVGESPGFAKNGGMIGFYIEGGKVRFEINQKTAESEGLKISSQLLKLARIIE